MNAARVEKGYEKYAWIIFVFFALVFVYDAFIFLYAYGPTGFSGSLQSSSPSTYRALVYVGTLTGILFLGVAIFTVAIAVNSFRRGEKWAWYVFALIPVFSISIIVLTQQVIGTVQYILYPNIGLLALLMIGLALPYRKFFPKRAGL